MDTQRVSIIQYVATYLCSYVALVFVFLLRCLLIASWFPKVTQLPKAVRTYIPSRKILKFNWSEVVS